MKYFGIFDKNFERIFQLQWKIRNISDMFLQYSVLCGKLFSPDLMPMQIFFHDNYNVDSNTEHWETKITLLSHEAAGLKNIGEFSMINLSFDDETFVKQNRRRRNNIRKLFTQLLYS